MEIEPSEDERGLFARTFCVDELGALGLDVRVAQTSISFNPRAGTLRGLHHQAEPHAEAKLVRCTRGSVHDVVVDLRPGPTRNHWAAFDLSEANHRAVYVPPGVAHGFLTMTDDVELLYQISVPHVPEASRGVRWDDPAFGIDWPARPTVISERDATFPDVES